MVRFGILGPLECSTGRDRLRPPAPRYQRLLAALLVDVGRPVPVADLTRVIWDEWPPTTARTQIQSGVWMLRRTFADEPCPPRIEYGQAGYSLHLDGCELDLVTFRDLVARGYAERERGDLGAAAEALRAAVALWRGPALAGLDTGRLRGRAERLEESRLTTTENLLRLELRLGRIAEILDELPDLVSRHPLRERLVELEMRVMLAAGRRGEALMAYARLRARLADELGLDPAPWLAALHRDILRGDPARGELAPARARRPPARHGVRRALRRVPVA
jgi:DNA-binding SARP family transcriptional activator